MSHQYRAPDCPRCGGEVWAESCGDIYFDLCDACGWHLNTEVLPPDSEGRMVFRLKGTDYPELTERVSS